VSGIARFNEVGDLRPGVHQVTLTQVIQLFGQGSAQRRLVAQRLQRIYEVAVHTGQLARFIIFGSFVTAHPDPNDVDLFLLMDDMFSAEDLRGEASVLFNHILAQTYFGASVFWLRRSAALGDEQAMIEHWQIKRDGTHRGILEVTAGDQE
jgi:hypothetical protein